MHREIFANLSWSTLPKKYPPNQRDLNKAEEPEVSHIPTSVTIEHAAHVIHRLLVFERFFGRFSAVMVYPIGFCFTLCLVTLLCLTPIFLGGDPLGFYPEEDQSQFLHKLLYIHTPLDREPATISHLPLQSSRVLHRPELVWDRWPRCRKKPMVW